MNDTYFWKPKYKMLLSLNHDTHIKLHSLAKIHKSKTNVIRILIEKEYQRLKDEKGIDADENIVDRPIA